VAPAQRTPGEGCEAWNAWKLSGREGSTARGQACETDRSKHATASQRWGRARQRDTQAVRASSKWAQVACQAAGHASKWGGGRAQGLPAGATRGGRVPCGGGSGGGRGTDNPKTGASV
jgi:hypothetical protein